MVVNNNWRHGFGGELFQVVTRGKSDGGVESYCSAVCVYRTGESRRIWEDKQEMKGIERIEGAAGVHADVLRFFILLLRVGCCFSVPGQDAACVPDRVFVHIVYCAQYKHCMHITVCVREVTKSSISSFLEMRNSFRRRRNPT